MKETLFIAHNRIDGAVNHAVFLAQQHYNRVGLPRVVKSAQFTAAGIEVEYDETVYDRVSEAAAKRQAEIDAALAEFADGEVVEQIGPEPDHLTCPKCGKQYKNTEAGRPWFEKHVAGCK